MACKALEPIRLLQDQGTVLVPYLDTHVSLDVTRPVEVIPANSNDDATIVEVLDESMMAVRQIAEDGTVNTLCLSPELAARLSRVIDSFVFLGATVDGDWSDGRDSG